MEHDKINAIAAKYYNAVSFRHNHVPGLHTLQSLFYGGSVMINNTFAEPIAFTAEAYVNAVQSQIASGDIKQFTQKEISAQTEVFGKIAQRISVYEYNYAEVSPERWPRGVNYMQFAYIGDSWKILSMTWCDENESHIIPENYLASQFINGREAEYLDS